MFYGEITIIILKYPPISSTDVHVFSIHGRDTGILPNVSNTPTIDLNNNYLWFISSNLVSVIVK